MKKIFLSAIVLLFAVSMNAQRIDLGVKAGVNFSNITDASQLKNKTGFTAGAFLGIGFNKFAIQPEVLFSQQGSKVDTNKFDLDYINVPVMLKYYLIGDIFNIQVGPQFGFLINDNTSFFDKVETKDFDMSGAVGAGLDLPAGFRVDARYHFGFKDVASGPDVGKNQVVSLTLGYSFL